MLITNSKYRWIALSLAIMALDCQGLALDCSPGPHWIDDCQAGQDVLPLTLKLSVRIPCNEIEVPPLELNGTIKAIMDAGLPGVPAAAGAPGDPTHTLDYEVVFLKLVGHGVRVLAGSQLGIAPTFGKMTELADNPALAEKFSYYFFEVVMPPNKWRTKEICKLGGFIDQLPIWRDDIVGIVGAPDCENTTALKFFDEQDQEVGCLVMGEPDRANEIYYFSAEAGDEQVTLHWEAVSGFGDAGFHVWRAIKDEAGEYVDIVRLTDQPVMSQGEPTPKASYVDTEIMPENTYYYSIEEASEDALTENTEGTYQTDFIEAHPAQ